MFIVWKAQTSVFHDWNLFHKANSHNPQNSIIKIAMAARYHRHRDSGVFCFYLFFVCFLFFFTHYKLHMLSCYYNQGTIT